MTEPIDVPEFAVAFRGYDREHVDAYVRRLQTFLVDAETRAREAEARAREANARARDAEDRASEVEQGPHPAPSGW